MNGNDYVFDAMRTNDRKSTDRLGRAIVKNAFDTLDSGLQSGIPDVGGILNACLGLSGEVGEFNDMIKKWIFHEKNFDEVHAKKELGDVMWYVALMCDSFGWDLDEIMGMNIDKLKARYPEGFDTILANNRKEGDI